MLRLGKTLFLTTICAGALASAQVVLAAPGSPSFTLRPVTYRQSLPETKSYFVLDLAPGDSVTEQVRVSNVGAVAGSVELYTVDATTGQTSGTVYRGKRAPRKSVGNWVALGARTLTLAANESRIVSFTVTVPHDVSSGDHVGGIVAENRALTASPTGRSALRIKIRHLTVAAVVVRVPGTAVADLRLNRVTAGGAAGYQFVRLALTNRGNEMLKPTGALLLRDRAGRTIAQRPFALDTFLPGTTIDYPVLVPGRALQPGKYTAAVSLRFGNRVLGAGQGVGGNQTLSRTVGFDVSSSEKQQVFKGAPQLSAPADHGARGVNRLLVLALLIAALALCGAASALLVVRRRSVAA